ncbi:MAG: hypothetical protein P8Y30_01650 [candidate division WOR-3 bacterium]
MRRSVRAWYISANINIAADGEVYNLPVLVYPQILGLALGLDEEEVGLGMTNHSAFLYDAIFLC